LRIPSRRSCATPSRQLTFQVVPVPSGPLGWEEPVEIAIDHVPGVAIPRELEPRAGPLDLQLSSDQDVGAGHRPDDHAGFPFLRHEPVVSLLDRFDGGGSSAPGRPFEVRAVFPQPITESVGESGRPGPVILDRVQVPPAPDERLGRPQRHVQGGAGGVAVPRDPLLEHIDGGLPLIPGAAVRLQDPLSMSASDQIVITNQVLLAGDGLVVAQEVDGVHVAVQEVPGAVVEDLRDAMPHQPCRGDFEARLAPLAGQTDRIVAARVVTINVEDFHGIEELVIVPFEVEAILDLLPPEGHRLLPVGHPRLDGPGHDPIEAAEVVLAVGKPGVDQIGLAHVLHADGAIRLPGLLEGLPDPRGERQFRPSIVPPWTTTYSTRPSLISCTCRFGTSVG
jgi:hypothetical protein